MKLAIYKLNKNNVIDLVLCGGGKTKPYVIIHIQDDDTVNYFANSLNIDGRLYRESLNILPQYEYSITKNTITIQDKGLLEAIRRNFGSVLTKELFNQIKTGVNEAFKDYYENTQLLKRVTKTFNECYKNSTQFFFKTVNNFIKQLKEPQKNEHSEKEMFIKKNN